MIRLRLPVEAHLFRGPHPDPDLYRLIGYEITENPDTGTVSVEMPPYAVDRDLPAVEWSTTMTETTLTLQFRRYGLILHPGEYLIKLGPVFTVADQRKFDEFVVLSEW